MNELVEEIKEINEENDAFGTYKKAQAIVDFIELESNEEIISKNNLIAIYGKWGTGKSCLMKTIENKLNTEKYISIWFDTWKYEKDDNLAYSLFKYISKDNFWNIAKEKEKTLLRNAYGIFKSMAKGVELTLNDGNGNELIIKPGEALEAAEAEDQKINEDIENKKCLWEKIKEFETEFNNLKFENKKLVVFLDDLDRCESENIITLISSIKLLLSLNENIIFIMGIDKEAVTLALKNKYNNDYNKADEYLEKIFPINFCICNDLKEGQFVKQIKEITGLDEESSNRVFDFFYKIHYTNPRHIKKVLRKYYVMKEYLKNNGIDIENIKIVVYILYLISLSIFYYDEYQYIIKEEKEKIYSNILLVGKDRNGNRTEGKFDVYNKQCSYDFSEEKKYDIYELLVRFSSYKIVNKDLLCTKTTQRDAFIPLENWLTLFENGICNYFIEYLLDNKELLDVFAKEDNSIDGNKIYSFIKIIDEII